jgi:hypothetical protein
VERQPKAFRTGSVGKLLAVICLYDDIGVGMGPEETDYLFIRAMITVHVEYNQIRVEGCDILLRGAQ